MIRPPRRARKAKAIAEALALIADTDSPEPAHLAGGKDERVWEDATAFSAALEKLFERHLDVKAGKHARRRHEIWLG